MSAVSNKQLLKVTKKEKEKENNKTSIKDFLLCKCLINFFSSMNNNNKKCISKYSIFCQFIVFIAPVTLILGFLLTFGHIYIFEITFKFDYYTAIKEDYLQYLITDIEDINFNLSTVEIKNQFEDIGNILFFKIYFEELVSLGLLDENDLKIFPNISNLTEKSDDNDDFIQKMDNLDSIFSIPSNSSKKYIDERNDSLSELAKIYFHFYPIISYEACSSGTYINQTYLIAYEIGENNSIQGSEMYFNFPRLNDDYSKDICFSPSNNFISPKISSNGNHELELIDDSFYYDNWFINSDYSFRKQASETYNLRLGFLHLNYHNRKSIDKSTILSTQNFVKGKEKKFIINIIYYISQKNIIQDHFDYSLFMVNNYSDTMLKKRKYSDNQTYVISKDKITEITLSSIPEQYFQLGLREKKNNKFYKNGKFFDSFDIESLSEPTEYYSTLKGFNYDIRYFSPFYLYTKLFQLSTFELNFSEIEGINVYKFNDKIQINKTCSKFNFLLYKNYIEENNINCWNKKNIINYSISNEEEKKDISNLKSLPYCICLPFYCIKNNSRNIDAQNIEFVDELILPEKCQNNLKFYENEIIEENIKNGTTTTIKTFYFKGNDLSNQLKSFYMKFSYINLELINGFKCIIICIYNNDSIKNIINNFLSYLNTLTIIFQIVIFTGINVILVLVSLILILCNTKKIENTIYEFKKHKREFIIKLQNKKKNIINEKIADDIKLNEFLSDNKNEENKLPLLQDENLLNIDTIYTNGDVLIDKLFLMYCKFYKVPEMRIIQNYEDNKHRNKILMKMKTIKNSNELFNLFCIISKYIPKFNLDLDMDFNFFHDSKLLNNFRKSMVKKSMNVIDKEQIIPTTSIIYELLSTEMIKDYGMITNLNFNFITNINLYPKNKSNSIQNILFKQIDKMEEKDKNELNNNKFKIIWKKKNMIMEKIEEKFEQDDYLQLKKLDSSFNSFLIDVYHNLLKKIILNKESNMQ